MSYIHGVLSPISKCWARQIKVYCGLNSMYVTTYERSLELGTVSSCKGKFQVGVIYPYNWSYINRPKSRICGGEQQKTVVVNPGGGH